MTKQWRTQTGETRPSHTCTATMVVCFLRGEGIELSFQAAPRFLQQLSSTCHGCSASWFKKQNQKCLFPRVCHLYGCFVLWVGLNITAYGCTFPQRPLPQHLPTAPNYRQNSSSLPSHRSKRTGLRGEKNTLLGRGQKTPLADLLGHVSITARSLQTAGALER